MRSNPFLRVVGTVFLCTTLAGCGLVRAVTFPTAEGTPGGGDVVVEAIHAVPATSARNLPPQVNTFGDRDVTAYCADPIGNGAVPPPQVSASMLPPAVLPLVLAAFQIAYSGVSDEIAEFIEAKKATFKKSYNGSVNIDELALVVSDAQNSHPIRCLRLVRSVKGKNSTNVEMKVTEIVLGLEKIGSSSGMVIRLLFLKIDAFAASTQNDNPPTMQIAISIGISYPNSNGNIQSFQRNIALPSYEQGETIVFAKSPAHGQGRIYTRRNRNTPVMPYPDGQPVTFSVVVTETGKGIKEFDRMAAAFKRNSEILKGALGEILKTRLSEE